MRFFIGLHQPSDARHFHRCCLSVGRLRTRVGTFEVNDWIMDSQAFSTLATHGRYPHPVSEYARQISKWKHCGNLLAAVSQDYMCEPKCLRTTGLTVVKHQHLTINRYDDLLDCDTGVYIMPVIQGFQLTEYLSHLDQYGARIADGSWVGVGSVCKRNGVPSEIAAILTGIKRERPTLKLHGFGVKHTALTNGTVRRLLWSADSMAWSFAARYEGRDANYWGEAMRYMRSIDCVTNSRYQRQRGRCK